MDREKQGDNRRQGAWSAAGPEGEEVMQAVTRQMAIQSALSKLRAWPRKWAFPQSDRDRLLLTYLWLVGLPVAVALLFDLDPRSGAMASAVFVWWAVSLALLWRMGWMTLVRPTTIQSVREIWNKLVTFPTGWRRVWVAFCVLSGLLVVPVSIASERSFDMLVSGWIFLCVWLYVAAILVNWVRRGLGKDPDS